MLTIILISFGLAMDAFAVAIVNGSAVKNLRVSHALKVGFFFGGFQAIMPIIGWLAGLSLKNIFNRYDHWTAFIILFLIGAKMIYKSLKFKPEKEINSSMDISRLLILSFATSIDALAVGLTISFLNFVIWKAAMIIGLVTFILSFAGVYIGNKIGHFFENKIEILGGLVLISIGIKILLEHL